MEKSTLKLLIAVFCMLLFFGCSFSVVNSETTQLLDPLSIPKFVNQLDRPPPVYTPTFVNDSTGKVIRQEYEVKVTEFTQQILPTQNVDGSPTGLGSSKVWGYEGEAYDPVTCETVGVVRSTPGCTFEAVQGVPVRVKWVNNLVDDQGRPLPYMLPVDPTLHWANPNKMDMPSAMMSALAFPPGYEEAQTPVPIVTHLHGGEVPSTSDGHPDAWWTADGKHGAAYNTDVNTESNSAVFTYPNEQQPTSLWYHDHALGLTRLNVLSGLAGFYIIRNLNDPIAPLLPSGEYEMPLLIQDRSFLTDGSLYYPAEGTNPEINPYWRHFFLGDVLVVNGKAWPNMNVKQGQYRFRVLDGSNSRFYMISFSNGMPFTLIGTDGGYVKTPVQLTSLLLSPAERADILVDFSNVPPGAKVVLQNFAGFADSEENTETTGQIMQFTVTNEKGFSPSQLPDSLNPTLSGDFPTLPKPETRRILTFIDVQGPNGTAAMLLDGQKWAAQVSETPLAGSTEDWVFINPTIDAHPMHVHLVQFQVAQRQQINVSEYMAEWKRLNGEAPLNQPTVNVDSLDPFLVGEPTGPTATEQAWKDTVMVNPGEAVTIRLRWAKQNGEPFSFDASSGPGYVWHCHILEHEDNEMMRPYNVMPSQNFALAFVVAIAVLILVLAVALIVRIRSKRNLGNKN